MQIPIIQYAGALSRSRTNAPNKGIRCHVTNVPRCCLGAINQAYIGLTKTTLRRRMQAHRNHGGINSHFTTVHDRKPLVNELLDNTSIVHRESKRFRLSIAEAVSIALNHPILNTQTESDYVLPSARRRAITIRREEPSNGNEPNRNTGEDPGNVPNSSTQVHNDPPRRGDSTERDATDAPRTALQGRAEPQPAEDAGVAQGRTLRPRRRRPVYTE